MRLGASFLVLCAAALRASVAQAADPPPSATAAPPPTAPTPQASKSATDQTDSDPRTRPDGVRKRPGVQPSYPVPDVQANPGAVSAPPPQSFPDGAGESIPDRWRLAATLDLLHPAPRWFDPYHQNTLKGDRPIWASNDWFVVLNGVSDTVIEPRSIPTPISAQSTARPGSTGPFGRDDSLAISQTFLAGISLIKGSTAFKPPDFSANLELAFNYNYTTSDERRILSVDPSRPLTRSKGFVGVQEAFVEYHLRDVSARYDFDAVRVGVQPFSTDFRGFLFQDNQLGIRFFGDRDDNRIQYNLAFFDRLDKEANSGLNDVVVPIRKDYIAIANIYRQDLPVPGLTSQVTVVYDFDREGGETVHDSNGFPVIPALIGDDRARDYDVVYLGYNADGHVNRYNLTASTYFAIGQDRNNVFTNRPADIRAWFAAIEPSYDFDWIRLRLSGLYASGDEKPRSHVETGFDSILENPQFAGADTSYFIRQSIPFIGGGLVGLNNRNGILIDLRSSKDEGQSNFSNPGTILLGAGADVDVTPQLRVSGNINRINFANTAVLELLRQQGSISRDLGWDYSISAIWRPWLSQNLVLRASAAVFSADAGFRNLFPTDGTLYSILINTVLAF